MTHASRRIALRIYLVSAAQVAITTLAFVLVGWLAFRARAASDARREAGYVVQDLAMLVGDAEALGHEVARVKDTLDAELSVYTSDGRLLTSSMNAPLSELDHALTNRIAQGEALVLEHAPPVVAVALPDLRGYALYRARTADTWLLAEQVLPGLAIGLIVSLVASLGLARSFARPLVQLTMVAHKLGEGDLSARPQESEVFHTLAGAIDDMAGKLDEHMRAQTELLANVSHELRTPLSRVRVALDLAVDGHEKLTPASLSQIAADLAELEKIVGDVLEMARLDVMLRRAAGTALPPMRETRLDMGSLLDRSISRFRAVHPTRELDTSIDELLPGLTGDTVLLRRAVDNLLDNAQKYSDAGSPILLSARAQGATLVVEVRDQGIGIAAEDLPHLTTPFFRTDRSRARETGGIGLGLSLVRRTVEAHGGSFVVESKPGAGTTVRMVIPSCTG